MQIQNNGNNEIWFTDAQTTITYTAGDVTVVLEFASLWRSCVIIYQFCMNLSERLKETFYSGYKIMRRRINYFDFFIQLTLKYFTVFTRSSDVASSSQSMIVRACCWKAETVHMWFTPSSIALYRANALWDPKIIIITWKYEIQTVTRIEVAIQFLSVNKSSDDYWIKVIAGSGGSAPPG